MMTTDAPAAGNTAPAASTTTTSTPTPTPLHPITQQALDRLQSNNPRTQEILQSLIGHLHAFVQDIRPTMEEWSTAIDFLTRTGQTCTDKKRQEFILLSDVLGVSMLVVDSRPTTNHHSKAGRGGGATAAAAVAANTDDDDHHHDDDGHPDDSHFPFATPSTVQGPFHAPSDPADMGAQLARGPEQRRGIPTEVQGLVRNAATGRPIANASLDIWQSDDLGYYDLQQQQPQQQQSPENDDSGAVITGTTDTTAATSAGWEKNLRATLTTADDGRYWFQTIRPSSYPVPTDGPAGELLRAMGRHAMRPAHIHFMVSAPGYQGLVTHLFVKGDPYLDSDAVFGVKESLIVEFAVPPNEQEIGSGGRRCQVNFDIGLIPSDPSGLGTAAES